MGRTYGDSKEIYNESLDVARIDLKKDTLDKPVDQFTMVIEKIRRWWSTKMTWESTQFSVPFTVKK